MKRDSKTLTIEDLVGAGVGEADAGDIVRLGLPVGRVGHLLCQPRQGDLLVLAYDADVPLVVEGGQVLAVDGTDRLVNTSVKAFVSVVERYARYVDEVVQSSSEDEGERIAQEAASEMKELDPIAFATDVGYWPIVCTQMVEGHL
jgi:hypothetical protein